MESVDFLETLDIPAYKVASADLTNLPLLDHLIEKRKPLILSTGMSRMEEVEITVSFLKERLAEFALLHCNSTYPAAFEDINLRFMDRLRQFGVPVGYSGHERGIAVSTVAAALGASILERHITHKFQAHHHHPCNPKEENIKGGYKNRCRVEFF